MKSLGQWKLLQNMVRSGGVKYLPGYFTPEHIVQAGGSTAN